MSLLLLLLPACAVQSGDIFQLVLSQRYERRTFADPFEVYRALRVVNPSPYMVYMQARGCIIVSSSPEILCRCVGWEWLSRTGSVAGRFLNTLTHYRRQRAFLSERGGDGAEREVGWLGGTGAGVCCLQGRKRALQFSFCCKGLQFTVSG